MSAAADDDTDEANMFISAISGDDEDNDHSDSNTITKTKKKSKKKTTSIALESDSSTIFEATLTTKKVENTIEYNFKLTPQEELIFTTLKTQISQLNFVQTKPKETVTTEPQKVLREDDKKKILDFKLVVYIKLTTKIHLLMFVIGIV